MQGSRYRFMRMLTAACLPYSIAIAESPDTEKGAPPPAVETEPKSVYEQIWSLAEIYKDEKNSLLQSFVVTGREQIDYATFDAEQGDYADWVVRRTRLGFEVKMLDSITLRSEVDLDLENADPLYKRLTDTYVAWSPSDTFTMKIGKQGVRFTLDGATSSKKLLTIDRSNLSNNLWFPQQYMPGITIGGRMDSWNYLTGIFSAGSASREFGHFDGSYFLLVSIGYDFTDAWDVEEALLSLDYVYQDPDENNTFTRPLGHIASLNFRYATGMWGFRSDLTLGEGYRGQSDLFGLVAMPSYNISGKVQIVGRYTYLNSSQENGVRLARYENRIVSGRGDEYNEFYLGLNWLLYGHLLKLQSGIQYATLNDGANDGGEYDGWGWTTGLRISW